jgi:hypothetical protein
MATTTKDGTALGQTIVTDLPQASDPNGNVPVAAAQSRRTMSPEAALLFNKAVVAKALMVPEVCSIHIKDTTYRYRWVNHLSSNGQFYNMRKSQGFINATSEDVDVLSGDATCNSGEITAGDLILMKIQAERYDAAIKWNMQKAVAQTAMRGVYMDGASPDVMSDAVPKRVSVANEPFNKGGKVQPFIPTNTDAIIDNSISSGRVNAARSAVDGLRNDAGL